MILCKIMCFAINSSNSDSVHTASCSPDSPNVSPSLLHPQLIMNLKEEIRSLRAEMDVQQRQATTIQETLDKLLAHLGNIDIKTQQGVPPSLCPTTSLSNTGFIPALDKEENLSLPTVHNRLKHRMPPAFNGDHTKGHAFMNSCMLYQSLCATEFYNNQAKIHWVLSYIKSNCPVQDKVWHPTLCNMGSLP